MLFNDERAYAGDYEAEVETAFGAAGRSCRSRIVAGNLRRDHRVQQPRARKSVDEMQTWQAARKAAHDMSADFEAALRHYFETKSAWRRSRGIAPEYLLRGLNSDNVPAPEPESGLINVLDLSKQYTDVSRGLRDLQRRPPADPGAGEWMQVFDDFPDTAGDYPVWLTRRMLARRSSDDLPLTGESIRTVKALLAALARNVERAKSFPVWVTTEAAFRRAAGNEPDRWLQVAGMAPRAGHWLIELAYPVRDVVAIARPTILEAPSFSHFPSPPGVAHGFAMELSDLAQHSLDEPLPEYLHRAVPPLFQYWENSGKLIGRSSLEPFTEEERLRSNMERFRTSHWKRIEKKCEGWLTADETAFPCG